MKRLVLALLLICPPRTAAAPQDAVVRITSHGCSGTVIHTEQGRSWVLTCAHSFTGQDRDKAVVIDAPAPVPGAVRTGGIRVVKVDYKADLVLIEVRTGPMPYVCWVAPKGFVPAACLSAGFDRMQARQTVKTATVIRNSGTETHTAEQPWHGRSGGALIDRRTGRLVGVVSGYTAEPGRGFVPGVSYGVYSSLSSIHQFVWPVAARPAPPAYYPPATNCPPGRT